MIEAILFTIQGILTAWGSEVQKPHSLILRQEQTVWCNLYAKVPVGLRLELDITCPTLLCASSIFPVLLLSKFFQRELFQREQYRQISNQVVLAEIRWHFPYITVFSYHDNLKDSSNLLYFGYQEIEDQKSHGICPLLLRIDMIESEFEAMLSATFYFLLNLPACLSAHSGSW